MAYEPRSRRLLSLRATWHRNDLTAYLFLRWLEERYRFDMSSWTAPTDTGTHVANSTFAIRWRAHYATMERLSKEVKLRPVDFDLYFTCRCHKPFAHVNNWLEAWRIHYNHIRYHMALGRPPCGQIDSPEKLIKLIQAPK